MNTSVIIPARWGSSRLPGKPLEQIAGKTLIERVCQIASSVCDSVYVATDDTRIQGAVEDAGYKTVLTSPECKNGTERVKEAVENLGFTERFIINFQGDAVLTPPAVLEALVKNPGEFVTLARRISPEKVEEIKNRRAQGNTTGTFVVVNQHSEALYFSKQPLPFVRDNDSYDNYLLHIGTYGYSYQMLQKFCSMPMGKLEAAEKLEQLRALEAGIAIKVVEVDYQGRTHHSVDAPEDIKIVEDIIAREGELV